MSTAMSTAAAIATAIAVALFPLPCRADNPAEVLELSQVEVVGATPLPGSAVPLRRLPANAQVFGGKQVQRDANGNLIGLLQRAAGSVDINAAQGNAFQADVQFRGFTASPLLGTPQGLSVYVDGVRVNEPFGDAVNWDLIAPSAISSVQLIPGSNPAFGLNTLGGAVAVYTKSGASEYAKGPGGSIALSGGSFGRRSVVAEAGGSRGAWDWFVTGDRIADDGWTQHSSSRVRRLFAKLGWQDEDTDLDVTLHAADNMLEGAQTLPESFTDLRAPYTFPDWNRNRVAMLALKGSHALSRDWLLSGTAYLRRYRNSGLSSNVDPLAEAPIQGSNDVATTRQNGEGLALQLSRTALRWAGRAIRPTFGFSVDDAHARVGSASQPVRFDADRGAVALGELAGDVDADTSTRHLGLYASAEIDLNARWALHVAGRFDRADVRTTDLSGNDPALNGVNRFQRVNPSIGLSYEAPRRWTAYANVQEGMRAPTAVELTCADPSAPCKLPNSFVADPPLQPVVARTLEAGLRSRPDADWRWSAAFYRIDADNDLQFVATTGASANTGYFQNVGRTRRQGSEWMLSTRRGRATYTANLSFIDATYRSSFVHHSPDNASADASGAIVVREGDRMPGVPRRSLKLRVDLEAGDRLSAGLNLRLASALLARGDENNLDPRGRIAGHGVVDVDARWRIAPRTTLTARIDNLFDARYANFGLLGQNVFTGPGQSFDPANPRSELFRGHGAPRGVWVGIEHRFGAAS